MARIKDWLESLEDKSYEELLEIRKALYTLGKWELFSEEYSHDLAVLRMVVRESINVIETIRLAK